MSRSKPLPVGPTAKLPQGVSWEQLASMTPVGMRQRGLFPWGIKDSPPYLHDGRCLTLEDTVEFF